MNKRNSRIGIFIIIAFTCLSFIQLRALKFDFKSEKFFPAGDPELTFFKEFEEQFQSFIDDEFIFIGVRNSIGIFQRDFLKKADSLTKYISSQENIINVYSLTSSKLIYFNKEEINARPLIHIDSSAMYAYDSAYIFRSPEYRDLLISKDGRSIAIAAFNKRFLSDKQKDNLLDSIQNKLSALDFDKTYLTAKIRVEREYAHEIEKNLKKYLLISLSLICLTLFILFRSIKFLLLPLLIIAISNLWTLALISLTGHNLDIISSLLPPILAAICMSDVVHISTHYIEKLRQGYSKQEALDKTYKEIGLATFFTCCTVSAGFITLGITNIVPIRNFGFFAAAGLFIAFGITMILLYTYFSNSPVPRIVYTKSFDKSWNNFLTSCFRYILKNKTIVFALLLILVGISLFYTNKIEINSSLLQEIPRKNPMLEDYRLMETEFSGTRPFEMALTIDNSSTTFYEPAVMQKVEATEKFLKDSCNVGNIISYLSLFKGANKAFNGGDLDSFSLPKSKERVFRYHEAIIQTDYADVFRHYMLPAGYRIRISGRLPNLSIKEFEIVRRNINNFFNRRKNDFPFSHHLTGAAILIDRVNDSLTNNLFTGVIFDALIICFIALFLLRNWIITLIILIPNVTPLIFMAGIMGFLGINLKADTSVIFAIALGLTVDDSIHFLSRLRLELSKGRTMQYAVKRTYISTGKAIVVTALILLSGFLTLLSSSFGGAFYIGLLISLCLFCAMLLELTITPLLILLLLKKRRTI